MTGMCQFSMTLISENLNIGDYMRLDRKENPQTTTRQTN